MPNRFNTPIQGTPTQNYTSQYVGLPLEELEASLQQSQSRYDSVDALGVAKKSELAGMQAVGNWASKTLAGKKKELDDFTSQYDGKDLGSREVGSAFKQKISDLSEDPDINKIQSFNQKYKQFQANMEKMKETGDYTPENVWQHQKSLSQYSENGDDSGFDSVIEKGVNIEQEAEKYYKSLHSSSAEAMRSIADGQGGSVYYDNKSGGISGGQIYNQANRMLGEFSKSAAGRQAMRRYQMESDQSGKQATQGGANQYLANVLLKAGQGMAYSDSSSGLSTALNKKNDLGREKKKADKEDKTGSYDKVPFGTYMSKQRAVQTDPKTGDFLGTGGAVEAFKEGAAANSAKGILGSLKGGAKAWRDHMFGDGKAPRTDEEKREINSIYSSYTEINKQRMDSGQPLIKDINTYNRMVAQRANKQQELMQYIPLEEKEQKALEYNYVQTGAIRAMRAVDLKNPDAATQTVDDVIRKKFGIGAEDALTDSFMKEHNIHMIGIPSSNPITPKGFGLDIDGLRILVDASASMGNPGEYKPSNDKEAVDINYYNGAQAEAKIGKHEFDMFLKDKRPTVDGKVNSNLGKFQKDGEGNYISTKVIAVFDPESGKTFTRYSK